MSNLSLRSATSLRTASAALLALTVLAGCTTKKSVRNATTPVVNGTNELDDKTAANNRALADLDKRTGTGINGAQTSAGNANQAANQASSSAGTAQSTAQDAVHRADTLRGAVADLDTYKQVGDVSVTFGFNKSNLTKDAEAQLDGLSGQLASQKSYILSLTGGTDSVGSATYNYQLSDERAEAVVQYLASKYSIPAHRFYLIGLGKDKAVADNATAAGRAQNRRVEVQLLTNQGSTSASASQ